MKKRLLSALLCAVMAATMAVGCGKVQAEEAPVAEVVEVREYASDSRHYATLILEDETSRVTISLEELLNYGESNESFQSAIKLAAGDNVIYNDGVFVVK